MVNMELILALLSTFTLAFGASIPRSNLMDVTASPVATAYDTAYRPSESSVVLGTTQSATPASLLDTLHIFVELVKEVFVPPTDDSTDMSGVIPATAEHSDISLQMSEPDFRMASVSVAPTETSDDPFGARTEKKSRSLNPTTRHIFLNSQALGTSPDVFVPSVSAISLTDSAPESLYRSLYKTTALFSPTVTTDGTTTGQTQVTTSPADVSNDILVLSTVGATSKPEITLKSPLLATTFSSAQLQVSTSVPDSHHTFPSFEFSTTRAPAVYQASSTTTPYSTHLPTSAQTPSSPRSTVVYPTTLDHSALDSTSYLTTTDQTPLAHTTEAVTTESFESFELICEPFEEDEAENFSDSYL